MDKFELRVLEPADAAAYRALRLRGLREHPEAFTSSAEEEEGKALAWSAERLTADPRRPHDVFLGAFASAADRALVGVVGLAGRYRPKERHNATVVGMYVAPEAAGRGVGAALMRELVARARAMPQLRQIDLTVTAGNDEAQGLYARCGFEVYGVLPDAIHVGERYHAKVHMVLPLRT